jgi:hypothetical protein
MRAENHLAGQTKEDKNRHDTTSLEAGGRGEVERLTMWLSGPLGTTRAPPPSEGCYTPLPSDYPPTKRVKIREEEDVVITKINKPKENKNCETVDKTRIEVERLPATPTTPPSSASRLRDGKAKGDTTIQQTLMARHKPASADADSNDVKLRKHKWRPDFDSEGGLGHREIQHLDGPEPSAFHDEEITTSSSLPSDRFGWIDKMSTLSTADAGLHKARTRNLERLREANEMDLKELSKYLPSEARAFFPFGITGPVDESQPSQDWLDKIGIVGRQVCPVPRAPQFSFSTSERDVQANTDFLSARDWDLHRALDDHQGSTVGHGSEFRPIDQLETIVGKHPTFAFLKRMFEKGFEYHLTRTLSEEERQEEYSAQYDRGNHQSALADKEQVSKLLEADVRHGFALPIRAQDAHNLKGIHLQPGGIVSQFSINSDGSRKLKKRFTHDLSFSLTSIDASINDRIDMSDYPDMVYGWCMPRVLHFLAALRSRNPGERIFISKYDYSDAYKRISQTAETAAATVIRLDGTAYVCLRMVFGGSPNPAGFSGFSETLTDLANELAGSDYDPSVQGTSPSVKPNLLIFREDEEGEINPAKMPAFEVETGERRSSHRDCFIDDIIDCHLDTRENRIRSPHFVQMAVHVMSRPHAGDDVEPVPRRPLLGPEKLEAEGRSSERQVVLGWEIQTRRFIVALPEDKYRAWDADLASIIESRGCSIQELESMIGRLTHASFLIPLSRHFLNEIRRKALTPSRRKEKQTVRFTGDEVEDMMLWRDYLHRANQGISINLLVIRTPTKIAWSDSCPFGLGGYTLSGWAWRLKIPEGCIFRGDDTVNNVLEFLGMSVSVLLLIQESKEDGEDFPCLMVLGDNTSAISWLFKSGRVPRTSKYYKAVKAIARHIARSVMAAHAKLCSQHLAGELNTVADILSFEGNCRSKVEPLTKDCPDDETLTQRIHNCHSQVVPIGFRIRPIPSDVESFVISILQMLVRSWTPRGKRHIKKETCIGEGGGSSSSAGGLGETPSSIRYRPTSSDSSSPEGSLFVSGCSNSTPRVNLLRSVRSQWYRRLFETPLAAWHRRSGNVEGPAPSTSRTESMTQDRCTPGYGPC